jgi:2-phosphosulfolactate phosphatase
MSERRVVADYLPESARLYQEAYAIIVIDVIRATTTAISAVAKGWRCFPVPSIEHALPLAAKLSHPLLVGELGGNMPYGFDLSNSPARLTARPDVTRPVILLSSSGTRLIDEASKSRACYLACLRNWSATARFVASRHEHVAVIAAGSRGERREEDQACAAFVAGHLVDAGYQCEDAQTKELIARWRGTSPEAWLCSKSVEYLRRSDQTDDLEFIRSHIDDLNAAFVMKHGEVTLVSEGTSFVQSAT